MQNALIFSPDLDGHRQVYVFVMAHILEELRFNVFIAGDTKQKITNSFYIDKLKKNQAITILDTGNYTEGGLSITLTEFLQLQNSCKADLTIFAEADNHISLFISQIFKPKLRLKGRVIGIFMRPFYYYHKNGLLNKLKFLKHFFSMWKNDRRLFYEFFLKHFSLLDIPVSIDENFVSNHSNFKWLPDVFQKYAEKIIKPDEKSSQRIWIEKLEVFKTRNKNKFSYLYFGTAQYRRGYDILLTLAKETDGCFIHCGLRDDNVNYPYNINETIISLKNEGRFFETNTYIDDPICIEYFFRSVSHLILPYRDFYGSSGVMLQALEYGIPVLGPDTGIIGYRIKKYNLGITYLNSDEISLKTQLDRFKGLDPKSFENDIKSYMNFQSIEQLKMKLISLFVPANKTLTKPILQET
jgi:hypothetical protein